MIVLFIPELLHLTRRFDFFMRALLVILIVVVIALQYRLWFGDGSIQEVSRLREQAKASRAELLRLNGRNQTLAAEVADLKRGLDAIEERARADLGMISEDETFYQFVRERGVRSRSEASDDINEQAAEPETVTGGE